MSDSQHNPYAPPKAPIVEGESPIPRPAAVLTAISIPLLVIDLPDSAQRAPLAGGLALIGLFLVAYALYLLFFPGREWFRAHSE